jgi:hypothetical protein
MGNFQYPVADRFKNKQKKTLIVNFNIFLKSMKELTNIKTNSVKKILIYLKKVKMMFFLIYHNFLNQNF